MNLGHERDPGQMLAEAIMQVLPNAPLFSGTYVQDCLFQVLPFRDVDTGGNNVTGGLSIAGKQRTRPRNQPLIPMPSYPTGLVVLREKIRAEQLKIGLEATRILRKKKQVPDAFALNLLLCISRCQFTSRVEA